MRRQCANATDQWAHGVAVEFGKFSGIFVEFWRVYTGLGPIHNYFLKPRGLAIIFPSV
jgi:hypothetical protein